MDIRVLDPAFIVQDILEGIDSVLWIDRFNDVGEVELYAKYSDYLHSILTPDRYLINTDSDRTMVIESVQIKTNPETGDKLIIRGRDVASMLDRRIVLKQIQITNGLQNGIQALLNANVINGVYPERNFPNWTFEASVRAEITSIPLTAQFYSQNLLDVILDLCKQNNLGFRVLRDRDNPNFVSSLYLGSNRSYTGAGTSPYIVFSPKFDNLIESDSYFDTRYKKNFVLVSGDPDSSTYGTGGYPDRVQVWTSDVGTGTSRREMFLDASDMPVKVESSGAMIPQTTYEAQLTQRGNDELAKHIDIETFNGTIDVSQVYKYRTDFFLGDIVQLIDNYGHSAPVRIVEVVLSQNAADGYKIYPKLEMV